MKIKITDKGNGRRRVSQDFSSDVSMTEQSHRKRVNINSIIRKYRKTGLFPHRKEEPRYGDFTQAEDFYEAQNRILQAETDFMSLPSDVRAEFKNDPAKLIEYINDPANEDEAILNGLIPKPEGWESPIPEKPVKAKPEALKEEPPKEGETS